MPNADYTAFHASLARWYGQYGRHDLPWRNSSDSYTIYVSEILLQQTQVKTVLERFFYQFINEFPTIKALGEASEEAVLKRWQGLGYYNRALNLHKTAKACPNGLPDNFEGLIALPGIGKNTAHAILAFAFHQPVVVLEANVKRIIYRVFGLKTAKPAELWDYAQRLLDRKNPFDYNQAMMDLGSMVCTPRNPSCGICPAQMVCKGKVSPQSYPEPKQAKIVPVRNRSIIILQDPEGRVWMEPRHGRFLNGLYGFTECDADQSSLLWLGKRLALSKALRIGEITQTYSHFRLEASIHLMQVNGQGNNWYEPEALAALPMSRADEKVLKLLKSLPSARATLCASNWQ